MRLGSLFVLVLASILLVDAKLKRGEINSEKDLVFLDTFYFKNSEDNILEYFIRYPADQCCYRLVVYDESYGQWGGIRPNEHRLTCLSMIDRVTDLDFKIKLSIRDPACQIETDGTGFRWLVCHEKIDFRTRKRAQNYFIQLANCRSNRKGFKNVSYELHMTNELNGLMKEFGENQKYILETDLTMFLGYVAMTIFATRFRYVLYRKRMLHITYKLYYGSLFLKMVSLLLVNIDLARFAQTGLQLITVQDIAEILSCISSILFVSVIILVSKGFSITRARVSVFGTGKMIVFGLLYTSVYTVVFFDQRVLDDPRDVITRMTSLSASGLIGIKIVGCIVFVYGCLISLKNYPSKALFYVPFSLFFTLWFMAEPIYRLVALYEYPVLRSPNIWNGIDLGFCFVGHAYFILLTRPDRLNKRFPFHLPAAKISFRDAEEGSPHNPPLDFLSIFSTEKKRTNGTTDVFTIKIEDDPEHFLTPVLPFNAEVPECRQPCRSTSPVATTSTTVVDVVPTVSASVARSTNNLATTAPEVRPLTSPPAPPLTSVTGFVSMPTVKAKPLKLRIENLPAISSIPESDQAAVGVSTVDVPRGGFGIFSVQHVKDIPESVSELVPDAKDIPAFVQELPDAKDMPASVSVNVVDKIAAPKGGFSIFSSVHAQKDASPEVSETDVPGQKKAENDFIVNQVEGDGPSFLEPIMPYLKSPEPSDDPTLTGANPNVRLIMVKPVEEPFQMTCEPVISVSLKTKDTVSSHQSVVAGLEPARPKDIVSAWSTESWKSTEIDRGQVPAPKIQNWTTEPLGPVEIGHSKSSPGLINSKPIKGQNSELPKINSKSQGATLKEGIRDKGQHGQAASLSIEPRSLDKDCQRPADGREFPKVPSPNSLNWNTEALGSADIEHSKSSPGLITSQPIKVQKPELPKINSTSQGETTWQAASLSIEPRSFLDKDCQPAADGRDFPKVPSPKTLNWNTEALGSADIEPSKSSPGLITSQPLKVQDPELNQGETLKKGIQDQGKHGPPASLSIEPRSWDQNCKLTVDGGHFSKVPSPKILNWNNEPFGSADIEHSKSSLGLITSQPSKVQMPDIPKINTTCQTKSLKEAFQDQGQHGPPDSLTIEPRSLDQDCHPTAEGGDFSKVPSPRIQNWNNEPLGSADIEHSKSSSGLITSQPIKVQEPELPEINNTMSTGQEEILKEDIQDPVSRGPPISSTFPNIGPRSLEQGCQPTADGGDSPKIGRKTQREPSSRRFAKPTKTALVSKTSPSDVKAMDPKTKKKLLRRFLKLARRNKPKPSKAD